jgi:hypothetical protein
VEELSSLDDIVERVKKYAHIPDRLKGLLSEGNHVITICEVSKNQCQLLPIRQSTYYLWTYSQLGAKYTDTVRYALSRVHSCSHPQTSRSFAISR